MSTLNAFHFVLDKSIWQMHSFKEDFTGTIKFFMIPIPKQEEMAKLHLFSTPTNNWEIYADKTVVICGYIP